MDSIKNGWFSEKNDLWPGQCLSLEVEKVVHEEKSDYQDIMVLKTKSHGVALILDGIIQCTEHDEFAYQEMIAMLPLCAHPNPENVLIVGGGDGGVAREVAKHPLVKYITQVEIDGKVITTSRNHLPFMSVGFASPKLTLHVADGFNFMRQHTATFDVIITDSSDPIGPAVNLFTADYFALLATALRPGGIICSQGGTVWPDKGKHVVETVNRCRQHFGSVRYAVASVPTYPTGQIGFILGVKEAGYELEKPRKVFTREELRQMKMKYYNGDIHRAAFVLPNFVMDIL